MQKKISLKFAIICDSTYLTDWQIDCIENLTSLNNVNLCLIILFEQQPKQEPLRRIIKKACTYFFQQLIFHSVFKPKAIKKSNILGLFENSSVLRCNNPVSEEITSKFRTREIDTIRRYELDFILNFSAYLCQSEILKIPVHGVWSFSFEEIERLTGASPVFWNILKDENITISKLYRTNDKEKKTETIKIGFFKTKKYCYNENINEVYYGSAVWPKQVCIDIINKNFKSLDFHDEIEQFNSNLKLNNKNIIAFLIIIFLNYIKKLLNYLFRHELWQIGIVEKPIDIFFSKDDNICVHWLPKFSNNSYLADPFGIIKENKLYIFCEEFNFNNSKGKISFFEYNDENCSGNPIQAIQLPVHMSYPYIIEYLGETYCIPETGLAQEVCLFKSKKFPDKWEKVAVLIEDFAGIDNTIFQYEKCWWLFNTNLNNCDCQNLYIWYSYDLLGQWIPHKKNPVKTDIRSSRPAGTPFFKDGFLYRPAQDCSNHYGDSIVLNKIILLTPDDFVEEKVAVIEPQRLHPSMNGIHTISSIDNRTIIDGKQIFFNKLAFKFFIKRGIKKVFNRIRA